MAEDAAPMGLKRTADQETAACSAEGSDAGKKVKATAGDAGDKSYGSGADVDESCGVNVASMSKGQDLWDGALVLSLVSKTYMPIDELWGLSKAVEGVVPRRVCIAVDTPEEMVSRLLQQPQRKANNEHHFPVVRVSLGYEERGLCLSESERQKRVSGDPNVARALTMLPSKLQELNFQRYYNVPLDLKQVLVDKVTFGRYFDSEVELPLRAREVEFGGDFNRPVSIPTTVRKLVLGYLFDCPLSLPDRLEVLEFHEDGKFNQPLSLPVSIREVVLSRYFNHPLVLPPGVEKVKLGADYNQPIVIPVSVRELDVGGFCGHPLDLPDGLEELSLGLHFDQPVILPPSLRTLGFWYDSSFDQILTLPPGLRGLSLAPAYNQPLQLPDGLEVLHFMEVAGKEANWSTFNHALELPSSLEEVEFGAAFNHPITIPPNLRRLTLGRGFDQPLQLPTGLEVLRFKEDDFEDPNTFNRPLQLPASMKEVTFGFAFNQPIELNAGLEEVEFGEEFMQPVRFRKGLTRAKFHVSHNQPVELPEGEEDQWNVKRNHYQTTYTKVI